MRIKNDWAFYFSNINDTNASIYLNLGIKSIAPDKSQPNLLFVGLKMNFAREDGLSSNEEYETLCKIEDDLTPFVIKKLKAIYLGRITSTGRREFYYYSSRFKELNDIVQKVMRKYPDYQFETGFKHDAKWEHYLNVLYPSPEQFQSLQNIKVINLLQENGDDLAKPRNVMHWIYFKEDLHREKFIEEIKQLGFNENEGYKTFKDGAEFPYGIMIERVDYVDLKSIDSISIDLWKRAKNYEGDYDGWETAVEK